MALNDTLAFAGGAPLVRAVVLLRSGKCISAPAGASATNDRRPDFQRKIEWGRKSPQP
jgi:hypothetical protein